MHLRNLNTLGYSCLHNTTQLSKTNTHVSAMFWLEAKLVVCCGQNWWDAGQDV